MYVPPAHGAHAALPLAAVALPGVHGWHAAMLADPPTGLYVPTGQLWFRAPVLPAGQ